MSLRRTKIVEKQEGGTIILSESISFRINKNTLDKLRSFAITDKTTLNALVNHLLTFAADWYIPASKTGWVPIPKESLKSILDELDEKSIRRLGKDLGKSVSRDLLLGMTGSVSVKDWVWILKNRAEAAGFSYTEINEGSEIKYIQQHNMGLKWSIYWQSYLHESFSELGAIIKCTYTDNTIVYKISKKDIT